MTQLSELLKLSAKIEEEFSIMIEQGVMPLFEIEIDHGDEYLIVDLSLSRNEFNIVDGVTFELSLDTNEENTFF